MRDNHITGTKLTKACDALSPVCVKTMGGEGVDAVENCALTHNLPWESLIRDVGAQ